jgi:hypothetical protein
MAAEPPEIQNIGTTVWERLVRAADDPADPLRVFVLATVTPEHRPAARLMTLRGADRRLGRVWCHTTRDSPKVAELRANPWFVAVAYDEKLGLQIRLEGTTSIHELDPLARDHFDQAARAREGCESVAGELPDPLWPGSPDELQHAITRGAWMHFAVIQMDVQVIMWTQVALTGTVRRTLHVHND